MVPIDGTEESELAVKILIRLLLRNWSALLPTQTQQKTFISEAQITTLLHMSREKNTFKHGIMTTITEECQLIFYN